MHLCIFLIKPNAHAAYLCWNLCAGRQVNGGDLREKIRKFCQIVLLPQVCHNFWRQSRCRNQFPMRLTDWQWVHLGKTHSHSTNAISIPIPIPVPFSFSLPTRRCRSWIWLQTWPKCWSTCLQRLQRPTQKQKSEWTKQAVGKGNEEGGSTSALAARRVMGSGGRESAGSVCRFNNLAKV